MGVTYTSAVKNSRMTATKTAAGSNAKLKIGTAGMATILAVIDLGTGGSVSGDTWTFIPSPVSDTSADAAGVAAAAKITTSADVDIATGLTVGTSGADVILDNTNIAAGQTVTINSGAIQHAA